MAGSVSGGCVEGAVVEEAQSVLAGGRRSSSSTASPTTRPGTSAWLRRRDLDLARALRRLGAARRARSARVTVIDGDHADRRAATARAPRRDQPSSSSRTVWLCLAESPRSPAARIASASSGGTLPPGALGRRRPRGLPAWSPLITSRAPRARWVSPSPRSARPRPRSRRRRRGRRPRPRRWRCRRRRASAAAREHALRLVHDRALDAAAGDGPAISPREPTATWSQRPRGGTARAHDRGERDVVAARAPEICGAEGVVVHALYAAYPLAPGVSPSSISSSTSASASSERRLWPGQEIVDVRHRGLHAGDQRPVALAAGQRVRPDDAVRRQVQAPICSASSVDRPAPSRRRRSR